MTEELSFSDKAKMGLHRRGKRLYIVLEFTKEYDAIQAFDTWSKDEISMSFRGEKAMSERE